MPALAVIYYRRNGGWLNSRTHLHPDDLLTLALFFFHSASSLCLTFIVLATGSFNRWLALSAPTCDCLTINNPWSGAVRGDNCAGREGAFKIPQRHLESQRAGRS